MTNQPSLFDNPSGKVLGQSRALSSLEENNPGYRNAFEKQVNHLILLGKPFTIEDVIDVVGLPSKGQNKNNSVGALMSALAAQGIIVAYGYQTAKKKERHGRVLKVWMGNNAKK